MAGLQLPDYSIVLSLGALCSLLCARRRTILLVSSGDGEKFGCYFRTLRRFRLIYCGGPASALIPPPGWLSGTLFVQPVDGEIRNNFRSNKKSSMTNTQFRV